MSGPWRVDQPGHDPQWFAIEDDAKAAAALRTPTTNAPVVMWFDSWAYEVPAPVPDVRAWVREALLARVSWLRMEGL